MKTRQSLDLQFSTLYGNNYNKNFLDLFFNSISKEKDTFDLVCDIGCGKGGVSYFGLKNKIFKKVVGCDVFFDDGFKQLTREANAEFKKVEEELLLPFNDNVFDLVFSTDVIEHIKDDITFFNEHIRIAKPNGVILIGTPNKYRPANLILNAFNKLNFPRKLGKDNYGDCVHQREYTPEMFRALLLKNNNIQKNTIEIIPYWLGLGPFIKINQYPKIFKNYCHYWFCLFKKL